MRHLTLELYKEPFTMTKKSPDKTIKFCVDDGNPAIGEAEQRAAGYAQMRLWETTYGFKDFICSGSI